MEGSRFAFVKVIQDRVTALLNTIPKKDFSDSFQKLYTTVFNSLVETTSKANKSISQMHSVFVYCKHLWLVGFVNTN